MEEDEYIIGLSPTGHLVCSSPEAAGIPEFATGEAPGLIRLAHALPDGADATLRYWKEFADLFMRALCHAQEDAAGGFSFEEPGAADLGERILNAPPMKGGEYLSPEMLGSLWTRLESWTREQVAQAGSIAGFLEIWAPGWSRVGRVTLHLAENKEDPEYPFAFIATYASGVSKTGRLQQLPLGQALQEYAGAKNKAALLKLLAPLHAAAEKSSLIDDLVKTGDIFQPLVWLPGEAYGFLCAVPALEDSGLLVRLPDWWQKRSRRVQVAATIGDKKKGSVNAGALLDYKLDVVVDGKKLSKEEIEALLEGEDGLVMLRGQWVEVDRERLEQALEHWKAVESTEGLSFIEGMRLLAGAPKDLKTAEELDEHREWAFAQAGEWLSDTLEQLRAPERLDPPDSLCATLRPYQQDGLNWLWFCARTGLGACLADDMGLGKTVQVLAALLRQQEELPDAPPALLVVPASLIGNWKQEAAKFAPSLSLLVAHRSSSDLGDLDAPDPAALGAVDLVVTTYGMLTRLEWPGQMNWSWVILDEAQAIKNHATRQSRAARQLNAGVRFALTGTPVENNPGDLWSIFDCINPGLLGSQREFKTFLQNLRSDNREHYGPLRRLVAPYILRRLKTDKSILSELPDKTEMKVFCGLSGRQAKLYEQTARALAEEINKSEGIQRRGLVLGYLMRFKQICNHPDQLTKTGDFKPAASAKFQRLQEICGEIASRGEKVLVFTQFREMAEPLEECLAAVFGRRGVVLHGGTGVKERQNRVAEFQNESGPPFFVLSLKAGGVGLNLTAASHVVHFDRWWNPAVENQATDRAFRIGQKRNVLVHKFVTSGTLEEKIDRLISEKQDTAEQILSGGAEKALTEMNNDELLDFIRLDLGQAQQKA
ncbi:MAG: DEAD/DEAH box helicase [Opitutales bacterium]